MKIFLIITLIFCIYLIITTKKDMKRWEKIAEETNPFQADLEIDRNIMALCNFLAYVIVLGDLILLFSGKI